MGWYVNLKMVKFIKIILKVKKCKVSALYFVLGNLPSKKRSMLSSINLTILCKTVFVENYSYESVQ